MLVKRQVVKEWYSTEETGKILGKAEFTVREWRRHGCIRAEKRRSGRGKFCSWAIAQEVLLHIQRESLLPAKH